MLLVCALLLFSCMDTSVKILTADHPVPMVVAVRYIVHCLLMIVLFAPSQGRKLVQTQRTGLVLVRAASLTAASLFVGLALQRMPVAEMTAITFLAPMLVMLLAGPLLRERIGAVGWTAAIAGFVGVLLVVRPGGAIDAAGLAFMAVAVAANTIYQLLSRILASTDRAVAMLFYTALVGSICFGSIAALVLGSWQPQPRNGPAVPQHRRHRRPRPLPLHARLSRCAGVDAGADELPAAPVGRPPGMARVRPRSRRCKRRRHGDYRGFGRLDRHSFAAPRCESADAELGRSAIRVSLDLHQTVVIVGIGPPRLG